MNADQRLAKNILSSPARAAHLKMEGTKVIPKGVGITDQMLEDHVKDIIIEKLSSTLNLDVDLIDRDNSFADYGVDSITGGQFVQLINKSLGLELKNYHSF